MFKERAPLDWRAGKETLRLCPKGVKGAVVFDTESFTGAGRVVVRAFSLGELEWGHGCCKISMAFAMTDIGLFIQTVISAGVRPFFR